jgi:dienelactone hydrolase
VATVLLAICATVPAPAGAFDRDAERDNRAKERERDAVHQAPDYQEQLSARSQQNTQEAAAILAADPERNFLGSLCFSYGRTCAGDVRLYDWERNGHGIVRPVLFTARSGATISGHVWATRSGPARRPGVVITSGSIQAPETLYWFAAQSLAKAGYVVLTWDPQQQGRSDSQGEPPDQDEGFPAQTDGRPFFDGTVDALDFFFSTPEAPFRPRPSCESGTSHAPKHDRRVAAGLNARHNPLAGMLDHGRVGVAGHSFGASGVSYVGQADPRVKAIVAWDNLREPAPSGSGATTIEPCPADPGARREVPITKPALGMAADYFASEPRTSDPDPMERSEASLAYSRAGVDTGEIVIRGGTHFEFSFIPDPTFGATLRGIDLVAWYTTAWFDKYVKGDATADSRLVTSRWLDDRPSARVDPNGDGNMYSFYFRSRLDVGLDGGGRFRCEDMRRPDCGLQPDCEPVPFRYIDLVTSADADRSPRACRVALAGVGSRGALRLGVTPGRTVAGRRTRFVFRATTAGRPVAGALVRFAGRRVRTDARGRGTISTRIRRPGTYRARATRSGMRGATTRVRVLRRAGLRRAGPRYTG